MSHLLGRERSLRQQCRRGRLPVRPAVPDRHGEQASYAGISLHLKTDTSSANFNPRKPAKLTV